MHRLLKSEILGCELSFEAIQINQAAPIPLTEAQVLPRARGRLHVTSKRRGAASVIDDLHQSGSMKALFPRQRGAALDTVFLNTAGGMTGGDIFEITAAAGPDSQITLTSQAAERIYGAVDLSEAQMTTRLTAAQGARIDWLPQETILFNQGALRRRLEIDLAADATLLMVEPFVFGRRTMGETVRQGAWADDIRLRRDGVLVFADAVRMSGDLQEVLKGTGVANNAVAMASVLYAAADAEAALPVVQEMMPQTGGVSLIRDGVLFARLLAEDSFLLRQALCPIIAQLHNGALPKTWML